MQRSSATAREQWSVVAGVLLVLLAVGVAMATEEPGGAARLIGIGGVAAMTSWAPSRIAAVYRAGSPGSLPASVGRVYVRIRPARAFIALMVGLALILPLAAATAALALVEWGWLPLAGLILLGCIGAFVNEEGGERPYWWSSGLATGLVDRLSMLADMQAPEVVVEHGPLATAWTAGGRIHVTTKLLRLLDDAELEAVLAHEVAHLARHDAAAMEVCSAPSRMLLGFARTIVPLTRAVATERLVRTTLVVVALAVLCGPPALILGWVSRLSVLGMSRARELSADAAAAALTGRPSALASALMKLERQDAWASKSDLRLVEPDAVLCIVAVDRRGLGRLFSTHPPTAVRVHRLEGLEAKIQSRSTYCRST